MDNRLVLTVLFVTLSWISMTTSATAHGNGTVHNTTTTNNTSMGNMSTPMPPNNMSTPMPPNNMSTPMPPHNMSTPMPGHNMTTPMPGNNMSTPMPGHNMTTPMANATTADSGANATTMATTATTPVANITVETLATPITRTECGTQELCASQPADCDPSQGSSCYFLSAQSQTGNNFSFGLSGESEGYIAVSLSSDSTVGNNDTTYVCANNGNGKVKFFTAIFNNGQLKKANLDVGSVKGSVNGNKIQCTFDAPVNSAQTRWGWIGVRATGVALAISTGPFDSSTENLGTPSLQFRSNVVDLSNPNATVTNTLSNTTTNSTTSAPATTSHAITLQQSLMQALLICFGILALAVF